MRRLKLALFCIIVLGLIAVSAAGSAAQGRAVPRTKTTVPIIAPDTAADGKVSPIRRSRDAYQPAVTNPPTGISVTRNVPYVERTGCSLHDTAIDIYAPADALASGRKRPVLLYVHGGGWTSGDHEPVGAKATWFTGMGFVFASLNYRLFPTAQPNEQAADLAQAIRWTRDYIGIYGGDGGQIFMLGHSAGAHLTALTVTDSTYLQAVGLSPAAIRGVILLDSAAYDVEQLMRSPEGKHDTFRIPFGTDQSRWRAVSPRAHVAPGKGIPPHLIILATADGQRRPAAEGLAAALRGAGVFAQLADATAFSDHCAINDHLGEPGDPSTGAVNRFIEMLRAGRPNGLGSVEVLQGKPRS